MHRHLFIPCILTLPAALWCVPATATAPDKKSEQVVLCKPQLTHEGEAIRLAGPNSIFLHDGNELLLAGILMPTALDIPAKAMRWQAEQNAANTLAKLVVGQSLRYALTHKWRDRYGRQHAYAFIESSGQRRWIQSIMVELGHARVAVENLSHGCARELLQREDKARGQRLGLWRYVSYAVRSAGNPWRLLRYRGSYQIVEGIVHDVVELNSKTFINFGKNKNKDFTAGLFGKLAKTARIDGQPLSILKEKRVRIRGWISWRGGPFIRIHKIAQIAISKTTQPAGRSKKAR